MPTNKALIANYFSFFRSVVWATKLKKSFFLAIKPLFSTLNIILKQLLRKSYFCAEMLTFYRKYRFSNVGS